MRIPSQVYELQALLEQHLPVLRPSQRLGLALWVYGTVLAKSACQTAVIAALVVFGKFQSVRQRLREWLYDGADKAAPCHAQVEVRSCFAGLLGWVVSWWQSHDIALAIDATLHGDRVTALVISVLYRGNAIPVAWCILPANEPGAWMEPILALLRRLEPAMPASMRVLVLVDRRLWSPRLWGQIRRLGGHPLMRVQNKITFAPTGQAPRAAQTLVSPGRGWIGQGQLGTPRRERLKVTLVAVWAADQDEPWVVVTDLPATEVPVSWYAWRSWIERGFRALKGVGWPWQHTRRTDPERVARYWLILAVAMLWTLAYGTRVEDAEHQGVLPAYLHIPPPPPKTQRPRLVSLFRLGVVYLQRRLFGGRLWKGLWLTPEPWPGPPPGLPITLALGGT